MFSPIAYLVSVGSIGGPGPKSEALTPSSTPWRPHSGALKKVGPSEIVLYSFPYAAFHNVPQIISQIMNRKRANYLPEAWLNCLFIATCQVSFVHIQSIPIQRLQGFRPSVSFLACKSKISLCMQLKTRRDGNLVNVELEFTIYTVYSLLLLLTPSDLTHKWRNLVCLCLTWLPLHWRLRSGDNSRVHVNLPYISVLRHRRTSRLLSVSMLHEIKVKTSVPLTNRMITLKDI